MIITEFINYALNMLQPDMIIIDDSSLDMIHEALTGIKTKVPIIYLKSDVKEIATSGPMLDIKDTISVVIKNHSFVN